MLRRAEELKNYVLEARDGEIGRCKDFLFEDDQWIIRYMVADTGKWLPGRKVLISPAWLGKPRSDARLPVRATKEQIRNSPPLEIGKPVTPDYEQRLYDYWTGPALWRGYSVPATPYGGIGAPRGYYKTINPEARGLESIWEVRGFAIQATDGDIGHVQDFILDYDDWAIRYIVVNTRNWLPGRKVLVSTRWLRDVHWADKKVSVDMTRESVRSSPEYVPEILDRE